MSPPQPGDRPPVLTPPDHSGDPSHPGEQTVRLSGRSLIWRAAALAAGTLLVINGSVFGNDVYWPFGPMSQFAFRTGTNDVIRSTFLAAVDEDGMLQRVTLSPANLGIARAEIEGQQPRFVREPDMLADLAANYRRIHPGAPELTQLWLCEKVTKLHHGRDAGSTTETVVGWPENSQVPADLPEFGGLKVPYRAGTGSAPTSTPSSSPASSRSSTPTSTEAAQ